MNKCKFPSQFTIETHNGKLYVCGKCIANHPIPPEQRINGCSFIKHPQHESKQCECIERQHATNPKYYEMGAN